VIEEPSESESDAVPSDVEPNGPAGRKRPFVTCALIAFPLAFLVLSTLAFVLRSQRLPELTEGTFEVAKRCWDEVGPASYEMDIELRGATPGTVHIEVRDGTVVAMQRDGQTPREKRTWNAWTVDGQFAMIDRELDLADDPVVEMHAAKGTQLQLRAEFDPRFGYVRGFHRAVLRGNAPEVEWRVLRFDEK
jgi:hypothetical protein